MNQFSFRGGGGKEEGGGEGGRRGRGRGGGLRKYKLYMSDVQLRSTFIEMMR